MTPRHRTSPDAPPADLAAALWNVLSTTGGDWDPERWERVCDALEAKVHRARSGERLDVVAIAARAAGRRNTAPAEVRDVEGALVVIAEEGGDAMRVRDAVTDALCVGHLPLVWTLANRTAARNATYTADDLFGWGWAGLRRAMAAFEPDRGFRFSTYAATRITGMMLDGIRNEDSVPKRLRTELNKARRWSDEFEFATGRLPRVDEVAEGIGATRERVELLRRCDAGSVSLDGLLAGFSDTGDSVPGWMRVDVDYVEETLAASLRDDIATALAELDPTDAAAVQLVLCDNVTQRRAAESLGVSAVEIRERVERGTAALREQLSSWQGVLNAA